MIQSVVCNARKQYPFGSRGGSKPRSIQKEVSFLGNGFYLFELIIVISLIGIISAIAVPIYSSHLIKAYRSEAAVMLGQLMTAIEEYYTLQHTYAGINLAELGFANPIAHKRYLLNIALAMPTEFKIEAIPLNDQAKKDLLCGILSLDSHNQKHISGKGTLNDCW